MASRSEFHDSATSDAGRLRNVPPVPARTCAVLNADRPSAAVSVVNPLLNRFAARFSIT